MNLKDIVTLFKNHQIQYGLNGDSNLEELLIGGIKIRLKISIFYGEKVRIFYK